MHGEIARSIKILTVVVFELLGILVGGFSLLPIKNFLY